MLLVPLVERLLPLVVRPLVDPPVLPLVLPLLFMVSLPLLVELVLWPDFFPEVLPLVDPPWFPFPEVVPPLVVCSALDSLLTVLAREKARSATDDARQAARKILFFFMLF